MSSKLSLSTMLDQRLLMNQKLKQVIKFLQYTTVEIKEQVQELLETNPLVELKEEQEDQLDNHEVNAMNYTQLTRRNNHSDSNDDDYLMNIVVDKSLREFMLDQTLNCHFSKIEQEIAEMLIDMIDDDGFITASDEEIMAEVNVNKTSPVEINIVSIHQVLSTIQTFEPIGIAARSIQQCLLAQIDVKNDGTSKYVYARKLVGLDVLGMTTIDFKALERVSGFTQLQLSEALNVINMLDFHPAKSYSSIQNTSNEPEIYVKKIGQQWHAFLVDSILTRVEVNNQYKEIIKNHTRDKAYKSVLNQLQEATFLLSGIKRRNETLLKVARYIVEIQQDFFSMGPLALKPFNLSHAAEALEFHESTISRITTGKYMATPHGVYELKYFFPGQVATDQGDAKSSTTVKVMIKEIIDSESPDSIYSDEDISLILKKKGINISRRTVTKYRESLNIPTSYLRQSVLDFNES